MGTRMRKTGYFKGERRAQADGKSLTNAVAAAFQRRGVRVLRRKLFCQLACRLAILCAVSGS